MTSFENILRVRVKEHLYTEFKHCVRNFDGNRKALAGKYVRKVWDIQTVLGKHWILLDGIQGAYPPNFFHILKEKLESDIIKRATGLYRTKDPSYSRDTHNQSVNYVWHELDEIEMPDVVDLCWDDEADEDIYDKYQITVNDSCFSGMTKKFMNAIENGFDTITGYFFVNPNLSIERAQRWIKLLRKHGYLMPRIRTYFHNVDESDYVLYQLTFPTENCQYDKIYFQLSMIRQLLEYHGTINITFDLMKEFNLGFELAHMVAMMLQPNKRWLHIPWSMNDYPPNMATAIRFVLAIRKFSPTTEVFDELRRTFKSSERVRRYVDITQIPNVLSDVSALKTINKLLE